MKVDSDTYPAVHCLHIHPRRSQKRVTSTYDVRDRVTCATRDSIGGASLRGSGEDQRSTYYDDGRPNAQNGIEMNG